jgi:hypothetical protein
VVGIQKDWEKSGQVYESESNETWVSLEANQMQEEIRLRPSSPRAEFLSIGCFWSNSSLSRARKSSGQFLDIGSAWNSKESERTTEEDHYWAEFRYTLSFGLEIVRNLNFHLESGRAGSRARGLLQLKNSEIEMGVWSKRYTEFAGPIPQPAIANRGAVPQLRQC